jgi:hypothetical protein
MPAASWTDPGKVYDTQVLVDHPDYSKVVATDMFCAESFVFALKWVAKVRIIAKQRCKAVDFLLTLPTLTF